METFAAVFPIAMTIFLFAAPAARSAALHATRRVKPFIS